MSGESFLNFIVNHSVTIIQVLVTLIILLTSYILYRIYSNSSDGAVSGGMSHGHSPNLEEALAKLAELQKSAPAAAVDATPEVEALREELIKSKNIIKELEQKIQELGAVAAAPAVDPAETEALRTKLADLEGRLSEYEIIAEDIADLGRYREENSKLKKEIEGLKGGASQAQSSPLTAETPIVADPAPASAPTPTELTVDMETVSSELLSPAPSEEISSAEVSPQVPSISEPEPQPSAPTGLSDANVEEAFSEFANSVSSGLAAATEPAAIPLPIEPEKPIDKATFDATSAPPVGETVEMSSTPPRDENEYQEELLNEFEGFIKKK